MTYGQTPLLMPAPQPKKKGGGGIKTRFNSATGLTYNWNSTDQKMLRATTMTVKWLG